MILALRLTGVVRTSEDQGVLLRQGVRGSETLNPINLKP